MINPMKSRAYRGYIRADQSPVEEENELEEQDLESGRRSRASSSGKSRGSAGDGGQTRKDLRSATNMSSLRPNVKRDDEDRRADSSDDEVPQSFIIETPVSRINAALNKTAPISSKARGKAKAKATDSSATAVPQRGKPLHSVASREAPPSGSIYPVKIPPRPSDLNESESRTEIYRTRSAASDSGKSSGSGGVRRTKMRSLDTYERALWNWVNVYNLDAFLQEVYYYYEGKGIYSIALARGLNLLCVSLVLSKVILLMLEQQNSGFCDWVLDVSSWLC